VQRLPELGHPGHVIGDERRVDELLVDDHPEHGGEQGHVVAGRGLEEPVRTLGERCLARVHHDQPAAAGELVLDPALG